MALQLFIWIAAFWLAVCLYTSNNRRPALSCCSSKAQISSNSSSRSSILLSLTFILFHFKLYLPLFCIQTCSYSNICIFFLFSFKLRLFVKQLHQSYSKCFPLSTKTFIKNPLTFYQFIRRLILILKCSPKQFWWGFSQSFTGLSTKSVKQMWLCYTGKVHVRYFIIILVIIYLKSCHIKSGNSEQRICACKTVVMPMDQFLDKGAKNWVAQPFKPEVGNYSPKDNMQQV